MGNSYSLSTPYAGSAGIDIPELSDLVHERAIGNARFMKSIRARQRDGVALVKVTVKPYSDCPLKEYGEKILEERDKLRHVPNALGFDFAFETQTTAYLLRQFVYSSLYDRMSTRPFLEDIEKKWLAFQLLCALRDCHSRDVYHGDIKTENVMVTSWNWLYLTDFTGSFKPTKLPDNNPATYSYFFDLSGRRTCYIAPERFVEHIQDPQELGGHNLTWSMDIFSAGCVIAEVFLETSIFSLSQMFKYRRGEYDPVISHLSRIPEQGLCEMLSSMIQRDPERRYSAEQYLQFYKGKIFPDYFYSFLHQYMELITDPTSGRALVTGAFNNLGEADDRIDRVFYDFDKITYFLGYRAGKDAAQFPRFTPRLGLGLFPVKLNIPNHEYFASNDAQPLSDDGTLIFLTLIAGSLRNTARAASKIRACDLLLAFSEKLTDEAKLDRVLPYLMILLNDDVDIVAIAALRSVTQLLALVRVVTPVNAHVFPEYIMPRMQVFLSGASRQPIMGKERREPNPLVRATYASCLGSLATTASKFLELAAILRAEGSITTADPEVEVASSPDRAFDVLFDSTQMELVELFEAHAKALVEDTDASVRRSFLASVPELCMFFGSAESNDILLTHLNTYLNDRDWMLKCAFFDTIVGISAFLGSTSLEEFSLPLMVQAVTDPEEHVVHAALHSLAELAKLGLLSKAKTWELIEVAGRFTMHPNIWVRESAAEYISSAVKLLSPADVRCIVLPLVRAYLKTSVTPNFSVLGLLDALKKPMLRPVFDIALLWAQKADKGSFWKAVCQPKASPFAASSTALNARFILESQPQSLSKAGRNEEDEHWLTRLRNMGMTREDEFKLLVLREFIWRLSQMKARDLIIQDNIAKDLNGIINLRDVDVKMQTIMFDEAAGIDEQFRQHESQQGLATEVGSGPYTITDALLDASMTIEETVGRKQRASANSRRSELASQGGAASAEAAATAAPSPSRARALPSTAISPQVTVPQGRHAMQDEPTSSDSPYSSRRAMRSQSNALGLLYRKDDGRSIAETGTTEANAFGQVRGPFAGGDAARVTILGMDSQESSRLGARRRAAHTYEGNDPNVLKMLDNMYFDNYPIDVAEYGPMVSPVTRRKASKACTQLLEESWKPTGKLVATFSEHHGAINRVVPSPDHRFFITGGDDGCVKVWDSSRLERNVTHRARQTHRHAVGARVVALCFIEDTHTFVSCASDGRVHLVKVETAVSNGTTKYVRLCLLREFQLPGDEYTIWCEHFKQELNSVLLLATNRSRVLAMDLRTMTLLYTLQNPVHHGTPTCFCVDRKRNWLLLGTSNGILDFWDLRFKMRLKGWGLPGKSAIHRLSLHPAKGRGKWVCVAGGTGLDEVTVWDLEKAQCREIYRAAGAKDGPKEYNAWDVDDDKSGSMLGSFATNLEPTARNMNRGVRAMSVGAGAMEEQRDVRYSYILTGGSDRRLRFWDLMRIENSCVISGLLQGDDVRSVFATLGTPTQPGMTLNVERLVKDGQGMEGNSSATNSKTGKASGSSKEKPPRHTVISSDQGQLLRSHLDLILDVTVLELPYTMIISVDRLGIIYVLQ
ncbi:hypothetical protein GGS20DRAFT_297020 [Poronia punctata]|nr:hypothetical protein GGS20DRAFT_297020 [Poronia punctata]